MQKRTKPPAVRPDVIVTQELTHIGDESQNDSDDSTYRKTWNIGRSKGKLGKCPDYKRVHALLLYWDKSCGDLHTEKEVNALKDVLETRFRYHTTQIPLMDARNGKKLQTRLNSEVASFIDVHDGSDTLLIIYYAGHGKHGTNYGHLDLVGFARSPQILTTSADQYSETSVNDQKNGVVYRDRVVKWNRTEALLKDATADVLEIFDWYYQVVFYIECADFQCSCYAGTLSLTRGDPRCVQRGCRQE